MNVYLEKKLRTLFAGFLKKIKFASKNKVTTCRKITPRANIVFTVSKYAGMLLR